MAPFDAYTPIAALLVHDTDANGIRAVINAVSAALIPASGVVVSRERFAAAPRRAGPPSSSVAVIPVAERDPIPVGIGWDEVAEAFEAGHIRAPVHLAGGSLCLTLIIDFSCASAISPQAGHLLALVKTLLDFPHPVHVFVQVGI